MTEADVFKSIHIYLDLFMRLHQQQEALFASDLSLTTAPLADRACLSLTSSARFFLYALLRYRRDETEEGGVRCNRRAGMNHERERVRRELFTFVHDF